MKPQLFGAKLLSVGRLPTLDGARLEAEPALLEKLLAAGFSAVEILHRSPLTWKALARVKARAPDLCVGVGTLSSLDELRRAAGEGAAFGVSPGYHPALVAEAQRLDWAYLPGVASASELLRLQMQKDEAGHGEGEVLAKFFPAGALGRDYLAQLTPAFPRVRWVPSGGLGAEAAAAFAALPQVICVAGSWMLQG